MLGIPNAEVEKISSTAYGWKRVLVAINGDTSEPRQLKLPPYATFAFFLERSAALHGLGTLPSYCVGVCLMCHAYELNKINT